MVPGRAVIVTARRVGGVVGQIEEWFGRYEERWNRGEVSSLLSMYHRSLTGILDGRERDFGDYTSAVAAMIGSPNRVELRLRLLSVRKLGANHLIATGRVTSARGRQETQAPFSVIFVRQLGGWKATYSHS